MAGMRTGSMMPPRDGDETDEELLAKVIPLRRRGEAIEESEGPHGGPWGAEHEPSELEPAAPAVALERSIWDQPSAQLPRRPQGARTRIRCALGAHVLHLRGLPAPALATALTGAIALAALAVALGALATRPGGPSQRPSASLLHADTPAVGTVSAKLHHAAPRHSPSATRARRDHGTATRRSSPRRATRTAAGTATSLAQADSGAGTPAAGSGASTSPPTAPAPAAGATGATEGVAQGVRYTPALAMPTQSAPREDAQVSAVNREFGFER
jgi:hypothetical protein